MNEATPRIVIGMSPHKRSVAIEVMTSDESILGKGRFGTTVKDSRRCAATSSS